ncbi:tRNA 2'-phosphotransferase 1 [Patella vulgata]|uniref:tRNA 2'-phosphotransferase 1 n=1 Tax=Patella vulgata TaxID=6465 RepID=UPI0021800450|nr:tRNA 2'-phosphotransferase 1 [Patella vulgata]
MAGSGRRVGRDVKLSKSLSWLLRHGAEKAGLHFSPGGFLYVEEILNKPQFKSFTEADIRQVVETNDKKRFALQTDDEGKLQVRANQGHTLQVDDLELTPVTSPANYPIVIHGTNMTAWNSIKTQGLSRMRRTHIHFATGEPGDSGVISGMKSSCDVLIYLNLHKMLQDNQSVFISANGVILSPGDQQGIIQPVYFKQVINRRTREVIQ